MAFEAARARLSGIVSRDINHFSPAENRVARAMTGRQPYSSSMEDILMATGLESGIAIRSALVLIEREFARVDPSRTDELLLRVKPIGVSSQIPKDPVQEIILENFQRRKITKSSSSFAVIAGFHPFKPAETLRALAALVQNGKLVVDHDQKEELYVNLAQAA